MESRQTSCYSRNHPHTLVPLPVTLAYNDGISSTKYTQDSSDTELYLEYGQVMMQWIIAELAAERTKLLT